MPEHVIIDGNNLLYAVQAHAPITGIGRETLVRLVERWAERGDDKVTLVFDGPVPQGGLARQMTSGRIFVRFSAPVTADDVIVDMIKRARRPGMLLIITGDAAIAHEARGRRCRHVDAVSFVRELFPPEDPARPDEPKAAPGEKPDAPSPDEARQWLDTFGIDQRDLSDSDEAQSG